ncbi:hypothetical protein VPH35_018726 [Triticum aestivum]
MFGVRSRGITFGPWKHQGDHPWMNHPPIYLPVGKKLFTLSTASFEMLSLEHIIYPPASYCSMDRSLRWSWEQLRRQPFKGDARLPGRCFYRVATFFLTYGMNGDLTTRKSRQVQYYQVPEATSKLFLAEDPVAFWM